jgi:alpha-mannosidase
LVYQDAEKLYAEVRADAEAAVNDVLCVLYPDFVPLSSAGAKLVSGPLTMFGHDTMPFPRRDVVRVPLAEGRASSGNVLRTTSDGKDGCVALGGGAGGVLFLPSQISEKELRWCANLHSFFWSLSLSHLRNCTM